ncbi:MAG: flagellar basal body P-ring formation protein FlgA [Bacteroidetes bacterium]|nr:flagellar basal body P-ring formation protein FlgA [Bacteroidota bacterium]
MSSITFIVLMLQVLPPAIGENEVRNQIETSVHQWAQRAAIDSFYIEYRSVNIPSTFQRDGVKFQLVNDEGVFHKGHCVVPVEGMQNSRGIGRFMVSIIVHSFEHVYVTNRMLQPGERLTSEVVSAQILETTFLPQDVITEGSVLENLETARIIQEKSVLTQSMCKAIPVLNPQDVVTLRIRSGNVVLSSNVVAKEEGYIGKYIKVQSVETRKQYRAKVIDAHTVELETN